MARNDVVNRDGSINYDTIGGFKDRLDGHDSSLADMVTNLKSYPRNTGETDDTGRLNRAITAISNAGGGTLYISENLSIGSTVTLLGKVNIELKNGYVITPTSNNFTMFDFPDYYSNRDVKTTIKGLKIDGQNQNVIGLHVHDVINLYTYDVTIINCQDTALWLDSAQFNQFYNTVLFNNQLGLYITNGTGNAGGGNSNSFYSLTVASNQVGVMCALTGTQTQFGSNYFYATNPLANKVAAFAFFSSGDNYIYGGCPEQTGVNGSASIVLKGQTVKQASCYVNNSSVVVVDYAVQEATVNPCFLLENNSTLKYHNPTGYGNTSGNHISSDGTSKTYMSGYVNALGKFDNVHNAPDGININSTAPNAFSLSDRVFIDKTMLNQCNASLTPSMDGNTGVVSIGTAYDSVHGYVTNVTFATNPTINSTRAVIYGNNAFTSGLSNTYTAFSLLMKASVSTTIQINLGSPTAIGYLITLQANVWTRVVLMAKNATDGNLFFFPQDNVGASVYFAKLQTVNTNDPQIVSKLLKGYFNPLSEGLISTNTAPVIGSWFKGQQILNSSPVASGNIGWICVTAGTGNNTAWAATTSYSVGQQVNTGGNVYQCTTAGTSGSTAPTGTGSSITDGSVTWKYVSPLAVFKTFGTIGA